ncbi:MAG: hypothetical protein AAF449_21990, partial [Myxococcota bacterium]
VRTLDKVEQRLVTFKDVQAAYERSEAQGGLRAARESMRMARRYHRVSRAISEQNVQYAERSVGNEGLVLRLRASQRRTKEVETRAEELETNERSLRLLVREVGLSAGLGQMLRQARSGLPVLNGLEGELKTLSQSISEVVVAQFDVRTQRRRLADPKSEAKTRFTEDAFERIGVKTATVSAGEIAFATQLLDQQQDILDDLDQRYTALLTALQVQFQNTTHYRDIVERLGFFLDQRLVWIRSQAAFGPADFVRIWRAIRALVAPNWWVPAGGRAWSIVTDAPLTTLWPWLVAILFFFGLRQLPSSWWEERARPFNVFEQVAAALLIEAAMVSIGPLLLYGASRTFNDSGAGPTAVAVSNALGQVAIVWFTVAYMLRLTRPGGLGVRDFRAGEAAMGLVHSELRWLLPIFPIAVFFFALILPEQQESIYAGLSRAAFLILMVMLAVFIYRTAHPERELLEPYFESAAGEWLGRLRYVVFSILIGVPTILGLVALVGYFFTAMILISRLILTVLLIVALLLARAVMLNWLRHARRKAVLNQHLRMQEKKGESVTSTDARALLEEAVAEFEAVDGQTRKVFRGLLILASLIGFSAIWFSVLPALEGLD